MSNSLSILLVFIGGLFPQAQSRSGGASFFADSLSRKAFFADGFHGGVYGHYPLKTYTGWLVDQMEALPAWAVNLELEPETWDSVRVHAPLDYARFKKDWALSPRVEFTNPTYAQPYMYNISGESILRQFVYGMDKLWQHFPGLRFDTYAVEEPCFTSALPQILRQLGFSYASLKCPDTCWGGYAEAYPGPGPGTLVDWIGPDGTSLLTSPRYTCEEPEPGSVWQTRAWNNGPQYLQACRAAGIQPPIGMCYQDAGWTRGPWIGGGKHPGVGSGQGSIYTTWRDYFARHAAGVQPQAYRFTQEGVRPGLVWGAQVLQRIAQQVRALETRLARTEVLLALADPARTGASEAEAEGRQAALDEAWRLLMLAQHHDVWIVPYNRLNERGSWADNVGLWTREGLRLCDSLERAALLPALEDPGETEPASVTVYNPLPWDRSAPVHLYGANGSHYSLWARVPALSSLTLPLEATASPAKDSVWTEARPDRRGRVVLENDRFCLHLDARRGGIVTSFVDKTLGNKEFVDPQKDYAFGELKGFFYTQNRWLSSADQEARISLRRPDPWTVEARVSGHIGEHPFVQTYTLVQGAEVVDCRLYIRWQGRPGIGAYAQRDAFKANARAFYQDQSKLTLWLPLALGPQVRLSKDAPFDVCESRLPHTHFKTWDSLQHNVILHWVDVADASHGLALLTDHTGAYVYGQGEALGLTLQYAGQGLWGRDHPVQGPTSLHYALCPHKGNWEEGGVERSRLEWEQPLVAVERPAASAQAPQPGADTAVGTSFLRIEEAPSVQLSALLPAPQGGWLLRLYNASASPATATLRFGFPVGKLTETDPAGKAPAANPETANEGSANMSANTWAKQMRDNTVKVTLPPFGIRTLHVQ